MSGARVLGEFVSPHALEEATSRLSGEGAAGLEAYTPYPIEGLEHVLGLRRSPVSWVTLVGALAGGTGGYLLQWWCNAVDYPINVGGRPPHSPLAFVPITFELAVLLGALGAFLSALAFARLPRLHHPEFELARFRSASVDRFWLSVRADNEHERTALRDRLFDLGAQWVGFVEDQP